MIDQPYFWLTGSQFLAWIVLVSSRNTISIIWWIAVILVGSSIPTSFFLAYKETKKEKGKDKQND